MQRLLLIFLCVAGFGLLNAQTVLEDFEGGTADLPWNAYEGSFAVIDNPVDTLNTTTPNSTSNTSESVGSYTKGEVAYSYFVAELTDTLDLSTDNQFSIQVYASAPTSFILKLERRDSPGTGQSIEETVNIPTAGVWRTYTFDFSDGAGLDSLNNIILFFDPGTEMSTGTYLFDNLTVSPAGDCAGTATDPTVLDDFECQRNATYGIGYDDLEVVANPDPTGINTSATVVKYTDRDGPFHALVIDYDDPVDLATNNYLCMKVWAPVTGDLLFKLEGGTIYEQRVPITQTGTWVEVCADLSPRIGAGNTRIVFFFNAGVEDAAGDVYYIDDITLTPPPPAEAIEDFEDGPRLSWTTAGGNNGTFNGAIANPDMNGNTSANVGSYTRGSAPFAALNATLVGGLDLTGAPQLNLDVWAPAANTEVTLQLDSPIAGRVNATATVTAANTWETLSFTFAGSESVTDFTSVTILFAPNTTGTGTYYFDNLTQGLATVDPCADVEIDPSVLDDFECQRNANYTTGSEFLSVVANPAGGTGSANKSPTVGAFADQAGAFNSLVIDFGEEIDLSINDQLYADIWAPVAGRILFKLEGGTGAAVEIFQDIPSVGAWNTYTVDLSPYAGMGYSRLVMFFGAGTNNTTPNTYYIDNLRLGLPAYDMSCVATFESDALSFPAGSYFENGEYTDNGLIIVENPDKSGINTSDNVALFEEAADGSQPWAGLALDLNAPITLSAGNKSATMKVWMPMESSVAFKLERGDMEPTTTGDIVAAYTTPGEWQELSFDLTPALDGATYERITLIFNNTEIPDENMTYYFDDIALGGADCNDATGIFTPITVDKLRVYPNPMNDQLTIENPNGAVHFTLTNMLGQQVKELRADGARTQVEWNVGDLRVGTYLLTAQDAEGRLVARSVVLKR
ncbi:T9SS type A sorting domain-containing protein [Lewinella sp. IMCC34183]|uniref:T9SS type A sorting domain-containing protein n=1 Tax=Lewinella sp. IMCC34183 TaxID=2248762 RepID=UPI000E22C430|nr:T9SS type A sorting domain-containing protein [Lewinella sp. IMCC34183]